MGYKDLSLAHLIPKWTGTEKAVSFSEFFETIEAAARAGNWTDENKIRLAILKLSDATRAFYEGSQELHEWDITWENLKAAFRRRFRDVRPEQYHFSQLLTARQMRDEPVQGFLVRCRNVAQRTVPQFEYPALQKIYHEQSERMLLATFTSGIIGVPGKQVRYSGCSTIQEALQIAITVEQTELQERRNAMFYTEARQPRTAGRLRPQSREYEIAWSTYCIRSQTAARPQVEH
jgi:hypothetical protein